MRSQNSKCAKENNGKPCLWKSSAGDGINDSPSLDAVHRRFASRPQKKDFFSLCSTALVVAQEFALSCFLLARHRVALYFEQSRSTPENAFTISQTNLDQATVAMSAALMLVLFCSSRSNTIPRQKRREKAQQRLSDAILLGIVLRLLASVLRTLTASYSSDTVEALATTGMTLHVVACDYSYANGRRPHGEIIRPLISSQRPVFRGGTFSLNAALFATTLLVSRVESNSMAYFLISLAIVMFAFYPDARHAIANSYPPSRSGTSVSCYTFSTSLIYSCDSTFDGNPFLYLLNLLLQSVSTPKLRIPVANYSSNLGLNFGVTEQPRKNTFLSRHDIASFCGTIVELYLSVQQGVVSWTLGHTDAFFNEVGQ